ncbi:unnamed protein product [Rotaria socialis]|uniref:U-box domain-containing protein n=2 Tax=Rotaria socialis TaxID=392032 RepID=A0A820KYX0_9BILA|nr:unnamed protein product [Rotaria socialis]CAF3430441.1 unnamed protein product [Rotaria socialis]CAF3467179.1 unnamed protein product [Rotaria socialis]CAF4352507.1 unnamed protein product [Rotaria socialis]CAF4478442.1 unnamed protein product [Rotaria socialis]
MKSMTSHDTLSVPRDFICPITREIMQNPVLLVEDGHSYEFDAIERWLTDNNTSPMTNKTLNDRRFVNNFNLKSAIEEYCAQQNTILSSNQFLTFNIRYSRMPNTWKNKPTLNIRLSLLGSSNAGKTTLARYLQYGLQSKFVHLNSTVTVAADISFFYLDQLYEDKYVVIIQLSDIPGMERYESCCDNHFRHCHGALIVTDSTDIDTLQRAELYWYKQLQLKGQDHVESMLVCNKSDLFQEHCDDDYRRIFLERAENFASLHQMPIHHVSALQGDNISSIFKQLILRILQNELLLDQIKESSSLDERSSIKLKRMRRAPATQVSLQSSTTEDDCDRNSSRRCC